ncbi:MAG: acetolactate synthase [Clostridia bacterium]|nr:acetolactate synthase [Clostridia bacterium]MBQ3127461.1 acetolactate synthase [Clostridia bacterium]MBQ7044426.1 acetolactate synthase [Clostridia bacterium]
MYVKQLSVFVENKFGRMAEILNALAEKSIDISALSLADTSEFGILRLIVDKPELAVEVLKAEGVIVKLNDILAIAVDDTPGGLSKALNVLTEANVVIEYMYAFIGKADGKAMTVIRVDDEPKAIEALKNGGVALLTTEDISAR